MAANDLNQLEKLAIDKYEKGQFSASARAFEKLAARQNGYALPHFYLSLLYFRKGELAAALTQSKIVLRIDGAMPNARLNLGCIYEKMGNVNLAIRYYKAELVDKPACPQALFNLGYICFQRHRFRHACLYLEKCLRMRHSLEEVGPMLAFIYSQTTHKEPEKEIEMYKRYLESNAESSWALQNLGAAFMDLSKFNLALVYLRKAKQLTPNDAIIQRNIDRIAAIKKING